ELTRELSAADSVTFQRRGVSYTWNPPCLRAVTYKGAVMQKYVLLIYQGTGWANLSRLSEEEKRSIGEEYAAINNTAGVTPGAPLGLPKDATTVRVKDGTTQTTDGPFVSTEGAVGGHLVFEAKDLDAAITLASRIPAARLGGAIEIRPVRTYW